MLVYPQLATGALAQYPVAKRVQMRTVVNAAADGSSIKLADAPGASMVWQLQYASLSDAELAALESFFAAAEGSLNGFTFLDPGGNLAAWSEDLTNAVWQAGAYLTAAGNTADPLGGTGAWTLTNGGAGPQDLSQTLNAPGGYAYCFSVFVRAEEAAAVTMLLGGERADCAIGSAWTRIAVAQSGDATADSVTFGIELAAGNSVDVFGFQAEAQSEASAYQKSTSGGVYQNARLRDDVLQFTTMAPNRHSATVNILYANHL
jgi:hypothetical protein